MKMIVISDNIFYRNAFTGVGNSVAVSPEYASLINETEDSDFYNGVIVVIHIAEKSLMIDILAAIMNKNTRAIFIEPAQWPARTRVFYTCNVFILPNRISINNLMAVVKLSLTCSSGVFRINPDKVRASEWSVMLYLFNGISNRHLAQMLNTSEKTISGRVNSLAMKMGVSGLNKATQLNAMYLFYLIYTLRKSAEERHYFRKQQAYISASVKSWSAAI